LWTAVAKARLVEREKECVERACVSAFQLVVSPFDLEYYSCC
jgi:hypothetical protein